MPIDLVFFDGCPHVESARAVIRAALAAAGESDTRWREWRTGDPQLPEFARGYGSPSIFVGGREVTGAAPSENATACRLYTASDGRMAGAPAVDSIVHALRSRAR
ncbi:MAG: hypothetical protein NDJ75_08875 [Thermoanaerobaculia bacterium]|nr:hypothetical protein [Thermoanaerobaculia bacterium]